MTTPPPSHASGGMYSPTTHDTMMGLSAVSTHMMSEDSALFRRRLPAVKKACAPGITRRPSTSMAGKLCAGTQRPPPPSASQPESSRPTSKLPMNIAGSMSMPEWARMMVLRLAPITEMRNAMTSPLRRLSPLSPPLTATATPPKTAGMAIQVLHSIRVPRAARLMSAAQKEDVARISSTLATEVWQTAPAKRPLAQPACTLTTAPQGPSARILPGSSRP
mmetsp:Transcript_74360/g.240493  ORF Transcript_74360/g.240493 Transcript_74360/m.240493 type:complete len:220 (-) Transcript_74360:294-953(-)